MEINKLDKLHAHFNLYMVDEIPSTNTYLKNEYEKYPDNTVLYAKCQTNGRGRYHRVWDSNGTICFSILLKKHYHDAIIAPIAICLALADYHIEAGIKWPNDVYLNGKKLAGILIEDVFINEFKASVVGIGINLSDKDELNAIGLEKYNIEPLKLIAKILDYYYVLSKKSMKVLIDFYRKYSIVINRRIIYKDKEYLVTGIDEKGHLVISNSLNTLDISSDEINIKEALINND